MGQHPNGQHGQYWQGGPPPSAPPPFGYAPPMQSSFSITKGYIPLVLMGPIIVAVGVGGWVVGTAWTKQQTAIESVQTDVTLVKQEVRELRQEVKTSVKEIGAVVQKAFADNPPWHVSVKQAKR